MDRPFFTNRRHRTKIDMKTCLRLLVLMLSIGYLTSAGAQSSGSGKGPGSSITGRPAPKKQDDG
uniref:hypothetical protein n=1 Tax=Herbaspirillum lusitanum TaxID=213312 RepID=UPI001EE65C0A